MGIANSRADETGSAPQIGEVLKVCFRHIE